MSWFSNIRLIKEWRDKKEIIKLTAEIEYELAGMSVWGLRKDVERQLVAFVVERLKDKFVDEILKDVKPEELQERALVGFKEAMRRKFEA